MAVANFTVLLIHWSMSTYHEEPEWPSDSPDPTCSVDSSADES